MTLPLPLSALLTARTVSIKQKRELVEFFGFETRNKYVVRTEDGAEIAFGAEQQKGLLGFFLRQILGHWRSFTIHLFDANRAPIIQAEHPFRIYFQELTVQLADGRYLGRIVRRFSLLSKCFDVEDASGRLLFTTRSPLWRIWTFPFINNGVEEALLKKRWGGFLKEGFLDADNFTLEFTSSSVSHEARLLLLMAALFVDLLYFEQKAN